jgi:hypothetical protein
MIKSFLKNIYTKLPSVLMLILSRLKYHLRFKIKQKFPRFAVAVRAWGNYSSFPFTKYTPSPVNKIEQIKNAKPRLMDYYEGPCSIKEHLVPLFISDKLHDGKKFAIIAHWDPHNIIDQYVKYYLIALKKMGYKTILSSPCEIKIEGDIDEYIDAVIKRTCSGYDFTSWKGALEYFPFLTDSEEVLITNDSIFAPITPLEIVHNKMEMLDCDFWGIGESNSHTPHLFSFYLVFKNSALKSGAFANFWAMVDTNKDKIRSITLYEIQLAMQFIHQGLKGASFISDRDVQDFYRNPAPYIYTDWRALLRHYHFPILKRDIFIPGRHKIAEPIEGWENELKITGYPVELINNYYHRMKHSWLWLYPKKRNNT